MGRVWLSLHPFLVTEQHFICIYSLVNAMSSFS